MALKNISVDDILNEIKISNAKKENVPLADMEHVDEIIKDILTKKQDEQLKRENRSITLREKKQLEDEIKFQTRNLTQEFRKLSQSLQNDFQFGSSYDVQSNETPQIKFATVDKGQKIKYNNTDEFKIPKEIRDKKEEKYEELKKIASKQLLAQDMKKITNHFSELDVNEVIKKSDEKKTDITKDNYRELMENRNKKIDNFVLEHANPELKEETNELASDDIEAPKKDIINIHNQLHVYEDDDIQFDEQEAEYEYTDRSQNEEVRKNLIATKKSFKISFILLMVLSVLSATLFFTTINKESFLLIGKFAVSPSIYALINMGIMLVSMVTSLSIFSNAIQSMGEHKADKDILFSIALIVCFLVNVVFCLQPAKLLTSGITLYTPIMVIILFINYFSKFLSIKKIIKNFDFISNDEDKYALTQVDDKKNAYEMTKGVVEGEPLLTKNVKADFFGNFLKNSFAADISDKAASKIAIFAIPVVAVVGVIGYLTTKDIYVSMSLASGTILMLTGFISSMIVAFPLFDTQGIVNHFSGMMPEYSLIDIFKDTDAIMVDSNELFPQNSVTLHGIKTFQGKRIDAAIVDAASVVCSANSVLKGVFLSIINNRTEFLKPVDSIVYEDLMGISAWVNEKRVLIGNRELMINHSVPVPKPEYEDKYHKQGNEVVFLASGGELCAAFIIGFQADRSVSETVNLMYNNDITAVVKSVDACITGELLQKVFDVDGGLFKVIPSRLHKRFDIEKLPREQVDSALGNNGSLFGNVVSIVACKKLSSCTKLGMFMYIISAVCGAILLATMAFLKNFTLIGNLQLLIYMASFAIVYWIYEKNMKL